MCVTTIINQVDVQRYGVKKKKKKKTEKRDSMAQKNEYISLQIAREIGTHMLFLCPFADSITARARTLYWRIEPFFTVY